MAEKVCLSAEEVRYLTDGESINLGCII